jgi:hypothetical protein
MSRVSSNCFAFYALATNTRVSHSKTGKRLEFELCTTGPAAGVPTKLYGGSGTPTGAEADEGTWGSLPPGRLKEGGKKNVWPTLTTGMAAHVTMHVWALGGW